VSAFDRQAEACRDFLQKGSQVCVEGTVRTSAYLDGNGEPQAQLQVNAREVQFLNRTKRREQPDGYDAIDNVLDNADFENEPAHGQDMVPAR
jgi:single-stranded DNA-binding protein